jgi:hypothetical protein
MKAYELQVKQQQEAYELQVKQQQEAYELQLKNAQLNSTPPPSPAP